MTFNSLVVCPDEILQVLSKILLDLSVSVEHCADLPTAAARLTQEKYDALLVDYEDEKAANELIAFARATVLNRTALAIAIVDGRNNVREIFANDANFILYKPISPERARASLLAARDLMRREKRQNKRVRLQAKASITYATTENASATLVNLSESGVAIQSECKLPPRCKVYFQFALPGQVSLVRLSGEVMWQDSGGRVGIRFADVPQTSRHVLHEWICTNLPNATDANIPVPDVPSRPRVPGKGLGRPSLSSQDRRIKSRHACRLGADVYRLGSSVPNRCTLTDISTGGCYVETLQPFPSGTLIEIVLRTEEVKLKLPGRVQSAHQGVGMGVQFTMNTPAQRADVEKLIACQSSETGFSL